MPVVGGEAAAAGICAEQEPTVRAQGSQEERRARGGETKSA